MQDSEDVIRWALQCWRCHECSAEATPVEVLGYPGDAQGLTWCWESSLARRLLNYPQVPTPNFKQSPYFSASFQGFGQDSYTPPQGEESDVCGRA